MQTKTTKRNAKQNGQHAAASLLMIPLAELAPPAHNTRREQDKASFKQLTESIKRQGVLQPILVRAVESNDSGAKYQIVAGERRFRAAREAGLQEIPAQVRQFDETEALSANIVENLQRADVHPLDEAAGFARLQQEMKLSVREIAQRTAKDARYIARRLALTNLIEEAQQDLRQERITLVHALEICRLAPEVQSEALAACYEMKTVLNAEANAYEYAPDKSRPARHVRYLLDWLAQNVHLDLQRAPFALDDARLREDGLTCLNCPQRSGSDRALFADIQEHEVCLNPLCFQAKRQSFVQLRRAELEQKRGKPAALISLGYTAEREGALSREQYQIIERRADRCASAEQAVCADGQEIGQVKWICRAPECKDHLGRVPEYRTHAASHTARPAAADAHGQRRQELFNLRVAEAVRKQVLREAIKTFAWPLERRRLNEAVKEFFGRIPTEHQRTICEVWGWDEAEAGKLRYDAEAALARIAALSEDELARFLLLCAVAHYGANRDQQREVDQSAVVQLAAECGVNHALLDAQARLELCPKKYRAAHQAYLEALKRGAPAERPAVSERAAHAGA